MGNEVEHASAAHATAQLQLELRDRLIVIETKLDQYNQVQERAYQAMALAERNADDIRELKTYAGENRSMATQAKTMAENCQEKVSKMEAGVTWLQRLVVGALALAVLDLVGISARGFGGG